MTSAQSPKLSVEFIPAEEAEKLGEDGPREVTIPREPWEDTLTQLANRDTKSVRIPRDPTIRREQVVNAFHDAFQLLGGTSRLTLWANENYGEFVKLYSKLLPRQVDQEINHDGGMKIVHVLPKTSLDE